MAETMTENLEEFGRILEDANIQPLWGRYADILPVELVARDRPMIWRWRDFAPFVDRAAREVSMENAVRRVLMLVNPAFDGQPFTTSNLFAGIQVLEPGEEAPSHRHTPSAMRFIMEGGGGATIVNGQRCDMYPGDLILTPNWAWHEHINDSDGRIVWLDALDLPLSANIAPVVAEHGRSNTFAADLSAMPDEAFAVAGLSVDEHPEGVRQHARAGGRIAPAALHRSDLRWAGDRDDGFLRLGVGAWPRDPKAAHHCQRRLPGGRWRGRLAGR